MGDEGFDPCECYWNHEVAMRRLLSLLRQGQSYCTDNECIDELPGSENVRGGGSGMMLMLLCWVVVVLVLYMMRPTSLRGSRHSEGKPNPDQQQGPQPPPALM